MDAYKALAASYDRLTNDVDYRAVVDFYRQIMEEEGVHPRSAVDLACGTGSCAVMVAANLCGLADRRAAIVLDGGELANEWDEATGHVFMTGPATHVFDGEYDLQK